MQAVCAELEPGEVELAGHVIHTVAPPTLEYVPAPQSVHVAAPVVPLNFPTTQAVHAAPSYPTLHVHAELAELAVGELELLGHALQNDADAEPTLVEYVPAEQLEHAALPIAVLYFPATQAEHGPPFGPVKPERQMQAVTFKLVLGDVEPEGHALHWELPLVSLYFPATQAVHATPSGPVYPAMQVHAPIAELPLGEFELAGHVWQVAALTVEYFAAAQSVHVVVIGVPQ